MRISQKQIAEELDVSIITVSRALRNHPDLSETTKARVLEKANELGYNKLHKKNSDSQPKRVGVLFYESNNLPFEEGVRQGIFQEIQRECRRNHYEIIIEALDLRDLPLMIKNRTVSAAFVFGRYTADAISQLKDIPLLAVSSFIECEGLPRIVAENREGMKLSTEHLIQLGHREIVFVGLKDEHSRLFQERSEGYLLAMHHAGLRPEILFSTVEELPFDKISQFSAIVCSNDALAFSVLDELTKLGRRCPEDFSIVSFDNLASEREILLTTYAPDWPLMGRLAANLLLTHSYAIRGREVVINVPGKLLIRQSTAPAEKNTIKVA